MAPPAEDGTPKGSDEGTSTSSGIVSATNRRRLLQTGAVGLAASAGCIAGEFPPAGGGATGGPEPVTAECGEDASLVDGPAVDDLVQWASETEADHDDTGRPLPVTGSWNAGRRGGKNAWSGGYLTDLLKEGHHVLPTIHDPATHGKRFLWNRDDAQKRINQVYGGRYKEPITYCAENDLPFAIRDWNMANNVVKFSEWMAAGDNKNVLSTEETAGYVSGGEIFHKVVSPMAPVERWREVGKWWLSNPGMKKLQDAYPDPPMIVMINNNEGNRAGWKKTKKSSDRFADEYGDVSDAEAKRIVEEHWKERYQAFYDAVRKAAPDGWADTLTFVPYNAWVAHQKFFVRDADPDDEVTDIHPEWTWHDGAMPEYYNNDWQIYRGKTDYSPWSPQTEGMNIAAFQDPAFEARPEYYLASIGWDGGRPLGGDIFAPPHQYMVNRRHARKTEPHTSRWSFERYEGMLQFGLWTMRPRSFREFRGGAKRDAYYQGTFDAYLRSVDRVWEVDGLEQFWRMGDLVPNPDSVGRGGVPDSAPEWLKNLDRRFLLDCDANPPAEELQTERFRGKPVSFPALRVFAMALQLGEEPNREWLLYAHAPLGAVSDAAVTIPGYDDVTLDHVAVSGTFTHVTESDDSATTIVPGGPAELQVTSSADWVAPGDSVTIEADLTVPPACEVSRYEWQIGGSTQTSSELGTKDVSFSGEGERVVRVIGKDGSGEPVISGNTWVFLGEGPDDAAVYDLDLATASDWESGVLASSTSEPSWGEVPDEELPGDLVTYRITPNRGRELDCCVVGGEFVDDPERGRVLKQEGNADAVLGMTERSRTQDLYLKNKGDYDKSAMAINTKQKTISLWVKPDSVDRTQVLAASGNDNAGWSIYVSGGSLYAGSWKGGSAKWLSTDGISAGEWQQITFVRDGTSGQLYINDEQEDSGSVQTGKNGYGATVVGTGRKTLTKDDGKVGWKPKGPTAGFAGLVDDFQVRNDVSPPS